MKHLLKYVQEIGVVHFTMLAPLSKSGTWLHFWVDILLFDSEVGGGCTNAQG